MAANFRRARLLEVVPSGKMTTGPRAAFEATSRLSPRSLRSGSEPQEKIAVNNETLRQLVILAEDEAEDFDPVEETGKRNVGL